MFCTYKEAADAARKLAKQQQNAVSIKRVAGGYKIELVEQPIDGSLTDRPPQSKSTECAWHEYKLRKKDRAAAKRLAQQMPVYNNSHRGEEANIVGAIGEIVAEKWLEQNGIDFQIERQTTQDYIISDGRTLDVKTKDRTVPPKAHFECSVPLYNHNHQKPDFYLFISLQRPSSSPTRAESFSVAYVLGVATQKMVDEGMCWRTGETDTRNGTTFWTSCLNLQIDQLISPEEAIDLLR